MARLDRRRHRTQGKKDNFHEKPRVVGIQSDLPPQSGLKWAVRQQAANQNLSEAEMDSPVDEEEETSDSIATFSD